MKILKRALSSPKKIHLLRRPQNLSCRSLWVCLEDARVVGGVSTENLTSPEKVSNVLLLFTALAPSRVGPVSDEVSLLTSKAW